jgi:hypothetical protein
MRLAICILLLVSFASAQSESAPILFPAPSPSKWMSFTGNLSGAPQSLLTAIGKDLAKLSCDHAPDMDDVNIADLNLGKLGKGVIVRFHGECGCGATGNCTICAYVREKNRYRTVLNCDDADGYAFALAKSQNDIPDIILVRNLSSSESQLTLFRYSSGSYSPQACETSAAIEGETEPGIDPC